VSLSEPRLDTESGHDTPSGAREVGRNHGWNIRVIPVATPTEAEEVLRDATKILADSFRQWVAAKENEAMVANGSAR
jgi:hypothetical protein